ncbi:MAG TPA: PilZ domain-containing protein [Planctomycetota bacterium]|nr:PilZ domain-containing protein [Planctomycetota bacterium]
MGEDRPKKGKRPGLSAEIELRNHFAGKRTSPRRPIEVRITICGLLENFPAKSVDVSRTGILFQITDDVFAHEEEDLASFAFKVERHFANGTDILFGDHGFGVAANVVRVTHRRIEGVPTLLLACRFKVPLTDGQCQTLGVSRSLRKRRGIPSEPVPDEQV